jgi:hypothetical protein
MFFCLAAAWGLAVAAAGQSAAEIYDSAWLFMKTPQASMVFTMTIHDSQGERSRGVQAYLRESPSASKMLARVISPAALGNMKFLRVATGGGAGQLWVKTSRGVRRVAAGADGEKLFGSDFTVEDFSVNTSADSRVQRLEDRESADSIVLQVVPTGKAAQRIMTIDRASRLVSQVDFMDAAGAVTRAYRVLEWGEADGIRFPRKARMEDRSKGSWTLLEITQFDAKAAVPDGLFNPAGL